MTTARMRPVDLDCILFCMVRVTPEREQSLSAWIEASVHLPAGVTAEMRIPGGEVLAYRIAPSLLTLDASGELGIKTVDGQNHVEFHRVEMARSEANGVWVTGLPKTVTIITVGQDYVGEGQEVTAVSDDKGKQS